MAVLLERWLISFSPLPRRTSARPGVDYGNGSRRTHSAMVCSKARYGQYPVSLRLFHLQMKGAEIHSMYNHCVKAVNRALIYLFLWCVQ